MGKDSQVQWCHNTWNPWQGCEKESAGCKNCYMYRDKARHGKDGSIVVRSMPKTFNDPLTWLKYYTDNKMTPPLKRVFTCSWSDWFIDQADAWRDEAWKIVKNTPWTYQILTKRMTDPHYVLDRLPKDWGDGYPNVQLGASVENQAMANKRIKVLMQIPAKVRFLSCEPLLGPLDITNKGIDNGYGKPVRYLGNRIMEWTNPGDSFIGVDWVIVGGESGNDNGKHLYRPCNMAWINKIADDCELAKVPIFIKQLGTHLAKHMDLNDRHGGDLDEFPNHLQIRQFPYYETD